MQIPIYKFIQDTDAGTGCDLFFREEQAVNAFYEYFSVNRERLKHLKSINY